MKKLTLFVIPVLAFGLLGCAKSEDVKPTPAG